MTIRSKAKKTWGGLSAKDVLNQIKSEGEDIICINGANYRVIPYVHLGDSIHDDDVVACYFEDATYLCLDALYMKDDVWLDCGTDRYSQYKKATKKDFKNES